MISKDGDESRLSRSSRLDRNQNNVQHGSHDNEASPNSDYLSELLESDGVAFHSGDEEGSIED